MVETQNKESVLVTGGSGFIGLWVVIKLLKEGYKVRVSIRSLSKKDNILATIRNNGLAVGDNEIEFFEADLSKDDGWNKAINGCKYIMHIASPVPAFFNQPENEDQVIKPAVEGTLRIIKAARDDGNVKRVILTSSFAAIGYSKNASELGRPLTENDWTIIDETTTPYVKSKVLAERAAWDFIENECKGSNLELAVINPTAVLGPLLNSNSTASIDIIINIIKGMKSYPPISFGIADVRDVADIHYLAMIKDEAKSQRFLTVSSDPYATLPYIANLIKENFPEVSQNITDPSTTNDIKLKSASNEKSRSLLNWVPRSSTESILSTVKSLKDFGLI